MLVEEQNKIFNNVMNKIFAYINSNLNIKKDLEDYYKAIGINKNNKTILNSYTINYIFERKLGKNKDNIFTIALNEISPLTNEEKEIITSFKNNIDGIFEVQKLSENHIQLFNIINEKLYKTKILSKKTNFKNLSVGHFIFAKVINYKNDYYLYHITDHINYQNRKVAFQIAISRLIQNPSLLCYDNPEKLEQLKNSSKIFKDKFIELFNTDCILTSNRSIDDLVELLNDYIENNIVPNSNEIKKLINPIENSQYFDLNEIKQNTDIIIQAKNGFSAQNKTYNVGLLVDEQTGLHIAPFIDIFYNIFKDENYKKIYKFKDCILQFVTNKQYPPIILKSAYSKFGDIVIDRINEILDKKYNNIDEIILDNKKDYLDNPYVSSTITLYSSYAFKKLLVATQENAVNQETMIQKIGRNEPCPCGSGLKYKKCCGQTIQI